MLRIIVVIDNSGGSSVSNATFQFQHHRNNCVNSNSMNPFDANVPFLYPLKTSENPRFFSLGIEMGHWREKG